MKTISLLAVLALLVGCTTTETRTRTMSSTETVSASEQSRDRDVAVNKRVYTQRDIKKSGRTTVGDALRTLDPAVTTSGR
jgi:hypothetical protein